VRYAYSYTGVQDDPERMAIRNAARKIATKAIRDGVLVRGACEYDKPWRHCEGTINAHHDDYAKPLDVRWLCHFHHANLHAETRNGNAQAQFGDDSFISGVWLLVMDGLTDDEIRERLTFAIGKARA